MFRLIISSARKRGEQMEQPKKEPMKVTMHIVTEWDNKQEFLDAAKELEATLEKANALADALAKKMGEIDFRIEPSD